MITLRHKHAHIADEHTSIPAHCNVLLSQHQFFLYVELWHFGKRKTAQRRENHGKMGKESG